MSLGTPRGHLVTLVDKRALLHMALGDFDVVCMKSHYADPRVWPKIHAAGVRAVNSWQATHITALRCRLEIAFRKHGVPIPPAALTRKEFLRLNYPVVQKPQNSAEHDLDLLPAAVASTDHERFFYQEMIPTDVVYKAYCVGARLFLFEVKICEDRCELSRERRRVEPTPRRIVEVIRLVQATTGLEIYNVDFVPFDNEYLVIDVNPFPGFSGIAEAADAWWDYIETLEQPSSANERKYSPGLPYG